MPLTISHAAAVLPLQRFGKIRLPLTALMIGSMAPDFGYFFSHQAPRSLTHSFAGLLIFSLPVGMVLWFFYVAMLEKATITLLPDRWHTRFAHTDKITPALIARAAVAILLGGVTHLVWDAFTHRGTFVTNHFPALLGATPGFGWLPIYHLLQGLSSVFGLWVLWLWMRHLHRQPARSLIRPYRITERARVAGLWLIAVSTLLVGLIDWLPYARADYDAQFFYSCVGLMSGFFIAWCGVSMAIWINSRRGGVR